MKNISHYIGNEYWAVELGHEETLQIVGMLQNGLIQIYSHGISTTREFAKSAPLELASGGVVLAELGMVFDAQSAGLVYLHADIKSHREISLTFCLSSMRERVSISFNPSQQASGVIRLLTSKVRKVMNTNEVNDITGSDRPTCGCCLDKQKLIREEPSLHPLFPLLRQLAEQEEAVNLFHRGQFSSSAQRIQPEAITVDRGVVYLSGNGQFCSIDLATLYHATVSINRQHSEPFTELKGFNSHGENVLEIHQDGLHAFQSWSALLPSSQTRV